MACTEKQLTVLVQNGRVSQVVALGAGIAYAVHHRKQRKKNGKEPTFWSTVGAYLLSSMATGLVVRTTLDMVRDTGDCSWIDAFEVSMNRTLKPKSATASTTASATAIPATTPKAS